LAQQRIACGWAHDGRDIPDNVITDLHFADDHTITNLFRAIRQRISALANKILIGERTGSDQRERNVRRYHKIRSASVEDEGQRKRLIYSNRYAIGIYALLNWYCFSSLSWLSGLQWLPRTAEV
jgi:hypothetical protein